MKHLKTFCVLALTSISLKDFSFLKDMIGGSLKIFLSSGCFCITCHFSIKTCLMFGSDGSYFVIRQNVFVSFIFLFKR